PVVLLDGSLSLQAEGARGREALDSALSIAGARGTILRFGADVTPFDTTLPAFPSSRLLPALTTAVGLGGPITVVTDGEIGDAATISSNLREMATILVLPRDTVPDVAVTDVRMADIVSSSEPLITQIALARTGAELGDATELSVWAGARRLVSERVVFGGAALRRVTLAIPAGALNVGTHGLRIVATTTGDREPRTDERYRVVTVSALPSLVLVASPPGWEATYLARELADIVRAPVGAYAQLTPERWIDLVVQRAVSAQRVQAAVNSARAVVRVGNPSVAVGRRPVWSWPAMAEGARMLTGEWYAVAPPPSPLAGRLTGIPWDALPPMAGVVPAAPGPSAWTALSARLARQGVERPILLGDDSAGVRSLLTAGDGLWRWALRGGSAREAYRGVVASGIDWLLGSGVRREVPLVVAEHAVALGEAVVFRWVGGEAPERVDVMFTAENARAFTAEDAESAAELMFDAAGEARVLLAPGFWRWRSAHGNGMVAVEPYSPELVPGPVTVQSAPAVAAYGTRMSGLRERWWLFVLVIGLLLGEWGWRVRKGLP
ncbi:MAG: hypothetical protein WEC54_07880, partial [Gemmatimonadales bacterium]